MACDGIWDVIGDGEAVELVSTILQEKVMTTLTCWNRYKDVKPVRLINVVAVALP